MNILTSSTNDKSVFELISDFVGHIIWPVLIFALVIMYKKDISELLKRIIKIKVPGGEAELQNEKYEKEQNDSDTGSTLTLENNSEESDKIKIDSLLKNGSPKGLFALYAAYLSFIKRKRFTLKILATNVDLLSIEYTFGFLVGVSSSGMFTFNRREQPFMITSMNEYLESKIKETVYNIAKKDNEEDGSPYLIDQLKAIEEMFK